MGSASNKVRDPIPSHATLQEVCQTLAAEQAIIDSEQSNIDELQQGVLGDLLQTKAQAFTDNTAFDMFTIPVPDENGVCVEVSLVVFFDDGTDHQVAALKCIVAAVNKGGTVTATVAELPDDEVTALSAGTLTLAIAAAEGADNVLDVSFTANSSLTPTTANCYWKAEVLLSTNGDSLTAVNADA